MKGFVINEVMSGTGEFLQGQGPEGKHLVEFNADWGTMDLRSWLDPSNPLFLLNELYGVVTIGGLCKDAPCHGSLELRYFKDASIRYTFLFEVGGVEYLYIGEKVNIKPWNLPWSHTTCFGTLTRLDTGELVERSVTHFRLKALLPMLLSLRLQ